MTPRLRSASRVPQRRDVLVPTQTALRMPFVRATPGTAPPALRRDLGRGPPSPSPAASSSSSSTHAAASAAMLPVGTRRTAASALPLTSTGVPALDRLLGGGLPSGACLSLREDRGTGYVALLARMGIAHGLLAGQHCVVLGGAEDAAALGAGLMGDATSAASASGAAASAARLVAGVKAVEIDMELPARGAGAGAARSMGLLRPRAAPSPAADLQIAWRYANLPRQHGRDRDRDDGAAAAAAAAADAGPFCSALDLTRPFPSDLLDAAVQSGRLSVVPLLALRQDAHAHGDEVADAVGRAVQDAVRAVAAAPRPRAAPPPFVRIVLLGVGGPRWHVTPRAMRRLAGTLKALLATSAAPASDGPAMALTATMPAHLYALAPPATSALASLAAGAAAAAADPERWHPAVVAWEATLPAAIIELAALASLPNGAPSPYAAEYHGLVRVVRRLRMGQYGSALRAADVGAGDRATDVWGPMEIASLGFRVYRKRIVMEVLNTPPEDAAPSSASSSSASAPGPPSSAAAPALARPSAPSFGTAPPQAAANPLDF
ncbi:hypothetical protein CXG81DRAFT_26182 [Caulochytrium protostelioides]|uniref:Elongator complex protein 4 n=1 Tax=Caulochytrium protostelioides TaxID=1555241 RepID=A0A4P9X821_9FUNG|nr:hypothetical protein CXG81DRAFT_26182 [Caulochytrium protostelioides]|eukprot:RKP01121.1 hypothetical protein CXG81DRAFT_26182 [Caulochytrium protostelioides]